MSLDDSTQHGCVPEDLTELLMEDRDEDDIEYLYSSDDTGGDSENSTDDL